MHYCAEHFRIIEEACVVLVAAEHASFTPAEEPSLLISRQTELQRGGCKRTSICAQTHAHIHAYLRRLSVCSGQFMGWKSHKNPFMSVKPP